MTSNSPKSTNEEEPITIVVDPDERCQICNDTRENHGDRQHKFSTDGQLIPLDPPPKPRQEPPVERGITDRIKAESFATLIEVLAEKGILDTKDVIRVFTGQA